MVQNDPYLSQTDNNKLKHSLRRLKSHKQSKTVRFARFLSSTDGGATLCRLVSLSSNRKPQTMSNRTPYCIFMPISTTAQYGPLWMCLSVYITSARQLLVYPYAWLNVMIWRRVRRRYLHISLPLTTLQDADERISSKTAASCLPSLCCPPMTYRRVCQVGDTLTMGWQWP